MTSAVEGDQVYLGSRLVNLHFHGIVQDLDTPSQTVATMEMVGDDAVVTMDALVGRDGRPGKDLPMINLVWDPNVTTVGDLPLLTDSEADKRKAYWIGDLVYVWDGERYHAQQPGPAGPTGRTPNVVPTVEVIPWQEQEQGAQSTIEVSGTVDDPHWHMRLAAPRGPRGENGYISQAGDFQGVPGDGQVPAWDATANKWKPTDPNPVQTKMYTVPEAAFQNVTLAVGSRVAIGMYEIPAQDHDFNIWVNGHLRCNGFDADFDPFQVGCEVRIGEANTDVKGGTLVSRGYGNSSQWLTLIPHASTPTSPSDAITPDGVYGRFAKGKSYRIGVYMFTDGLLGVYNFQRRDAQLAIQILPIYEPAAVA